MWEYMGNLTLDIWEYTDSYGSIWTHMIPWTHMGPWVHGPIWAHNIICTHNIMGPYGSVWTHMGSYSPLYVQG